MQRWMTRILLSLAACTSAAQAQDGFFDPGFANGGRKLVDVSDGPSDDGKVLRIQPDGKLLMGGTCLKSESIGGGMFHTFPKFCATRLRADGSYDTGFGPAGVGYIRFDRFEPGGFPRISDLRDMVRLDDGRILFMGESTDGIGNTIVMAMLTPDGSALDPGMAAGAGFFIFQYGATGTRGHALLVQADGKILVVGEVTGVNGNTDMAVRRFLPDFSVDTGFGNGGLQTIAFDLGGPTGTNTDLATSVAVQTDGRIVLAGYALATLSPPAAELAVARLLPNGQLDAEFGPNHDGRAHFAVNAYGALQSVRIDRLGRIVIAGGAANSAATHVFCLVNRLRADGSQDPGFNTSAGAGHAQLFAIPTSSGNVDCVLRDLAVQADGSILAVGTTARATNSPTNTYFGAVRLTSTGAFDPAFGNGGKSYSSFASSANSSDEAPALAIGNGGMMIAGHSVNLAGNRVQFGIARLRLDRLFAHGFEP